MPNVAVPMDGGTRWITEEERARIAHKYGPPHRWTDPNPRPGVSTTWLSYVPTADDVRELDREAHQRAVDEHTTQVTEERARERATRDRRKFLPRLTESVARGIEAALLHRADSTRYPATPAAARWLDHCPLTEVAERWLTMTYHPDPRGRGVHGLAMALLVRGGVPTWAPAVRQTGYLATSDLPKVLDNVANVLYLDAYTDAPRTFTAWTRELEVPDFRTAVVVTPGFPELLPVGEHAEFTHHGALGPTAALRLVTYGRHVTVTRQAVLADDMLTFGQLQQALGVAAAACESDTVYNLLVSNPTMADGNALFSVAHGNLMPAADITATSLAAASAALAAQTTADGRTLHLRARYVVVGTLLAGEARQLVTSQTPVNSDPDTGLVVVEDDRVVGKSWYVMSDQWPTVACAHLAATGGPELLAMDGWDVDGRLYKARDEFGCTVMDWRGMIYTPTT